MELLSRGNLHYRLPNCASCGSVNWFLQKGRSAYQQSCLLKKNNVLFISVLICLKISMYFIPVGESISVIYREGLILNLFYDVQHGKKICVQTSNKITTVPKEFPKALESWILRCLTV